MDKILEIIRRKPLTYVLLTLIYLLVVGFLKWRLAPDLEAVWFVVGGVVGIYFLDIAEVIFAVNPSPFRSILFVALFVVVSFFVITSSGSRLASGLVLTLSMMLISRQYQEWRLTGNLNSWYAMVAGPVPLSTQQYLLAAFVVIFLLQTFLFVR